MKMIIAFLIIAASIIGCSKPMTKEEIKAACEDRGLCIDSIIESKSFGETRTTVFCKYCE